MATESSRPVGPSSFWESRRFRQQVPGGSAVWCQPSCWATLFFCCIAAVAWGEISPEMAAMRDRVDELLVLDWQQRAIEPAPLCSDTEFLRRAYLDLIGRVPRVSEVRDYLAADSTKRRDQLVADLVERPGYATRMANVWRDFLLPVGTDLERAGGIAGFETWLRDRLAHNVPYDALVRELLLVEGDATQSGPALYFTAWELKPEKLGASTARAFLGLQLQCAECHDHPFDVWSQRDFWAYAAFFARLDGVGMADGIPAQSFRERSDGEVKLPNTEQVVLPKYLGRSSDGSEAVGDAVEESAKQTRRQQLATWLVSDDNAYFARAAVNRTWAQLFGRGIVDPPDDLGRHNPPSHPELLNELTEYFQSTGYDVRNLVHTLATTQAYQLSSAPSLPDPRPENAFAQMAVKSLTAEQLYDSLATATCKLQPAQNGGQTFGLNRFLDANRQTFLDRFRTPSTNVVDYQLGMAQALTLLNGTLTSEASDSQRSDLLGALEAPFYSDQERIETIFLASLARLPSDVEVERFRDYVQSAPDEEARNAALGDLFWALLNSAEFTLNH